MERRKKAFLTKARDGGFSRRPCRLEHGYRGGASVDVAAMYSLIGPAKLNRVDPESYALMR